MEDLDQPINNKFPPRFHAMRIINLDPLTFDKKFFWGRGDYFINHRTKAIYFIKEVELNPFKIKIEKYKGKKNADFQIGDWISYYSGLCPNGAKDEQIFYDLLKSKKYYNASDLLYDLSLKESEFNRFDPTSFEFAVNFVLKYVYE